MAIELKARADLWSEEDLLAFPESPLRCELLEGVIVVNPPAGFPHQKAASQLHLALGAACPPGFVTVETVGVRLAGGSLFIPDIVVVRPPAAGQQQGPVLDPGDIALAVEIVSPGSKTMDRLTKPALYAGAGIPDYWRVELDEGPLIVAYRLAEGSYREIATARPGQPLHLDEPFPVSFDPASFDPAFIGPVSLDPVSSDPAPLPANLEVSGPPPSGS